MNSCTMNGGGLCCAAVLLFSDLFVPAAVSSAERLLIEGQICHELGNVNKTCH